MPTVFARHVLSSSWLCSQNEYFKVCTALNYTPCRPKSSQEWACCAENGHQGSKFAR